MDESTKISFLQNLHRILYRNRLLGFVGLGAIGVLVAIFLAPKSLPIVLSGQNSTKRVRSA